MSCIKISNHENSFLSKTTKIKKNFKALFFKTFFTRQTACDSQSNWDAVTYT